VWKSPHRKPDQAEHSKTDFFTADTLFLV
jgi:hypothetical protein